MKNSRGLRNRNPGNIRCSGTRYKGEIIPSQDPAFKQFETIAWGYRALFVLLHSYRKRHGLQTIRQWITRYAPPVENHTEAYITAVAREAGIAPDAPVDTADRQQMIPIVAAMSRIENGVPAVAAEVEAGWELYLK